MPTSTTNAKDTTMLVRQGQFAYLPDLTDAEIEKQVQYAIGHEWGIGIEHTTDPDPRNKFWHLWGSPRFGVTTTGTIMDEIRACRESNPSSHIAIKAFQSTRQRQGVMLHVLVQRPES